MRIELANVTKAFEDGIPVLDRLNFADDITTLAIIGHSGCGKSTLLRILGGLVPLTSGSLVVDGIPVFPDEAHLIAHRRQLGFVFQKSGLFYHMTALDNIIIPLVAVHGFSREAAEARATELLVRFGLEGEKAKKPYALSGGQQQRIAIARAIAPRPKLLLLDEPTSALDPEYTTEVLNMINELREEGMQFMIVTHEMGFARRACVQIAFLHGGRIWEYGGSQEIFVQPRTPELRQFLGKLLEWNA